MKKKLSVRLSAVLLCLCIILTVCSCGAKKAEFTSFAMGSAVTAAVYTENEDEAAALWSEICTAISDSDKALSATDKASDISRINASGTAVVSKYTVSFLEKAVLLCNTLDRKTDITLGAATSLWGFSSDSPQVPDEEALKNAVGTVDIDGIFIDEANSTVSLQKGQKLDLGALGKGEGCDIIREKLTEKGLSACVSFGGNILVTGKNPSGKNGMWKIGLRDPKKGVNDVFAYLTVDSSSGAVCISTSGSYEKAFELNGKKYHHILDPETGYPVENGIASVSVICRSGLNADALSTALFVNGLNDRALSFLKAFSAEAVFVFKNGSVYATKGADKILTISNNSSYKTVSYEEAAK